MKEYIVVLKRDADPSDFQADMTQTTGRSDSTSSGLPYSIPSRSVDIANPRLKSKRSTHYALEDNEVEQIKQDHRVVDVHIPPDQDESIEIGLDARQDANFQKPFYNNQNLAFVNWGLRRCVEGTNVYGYSTADPGGFYTYNLNGTGVDVVIQDSGLQTDHPDFYDASGVSRVQNIDWYTESGVAGTQNANHNRDFDGHGTHVGGIAAGLTYGWAKNARIYHVKVSGLNGSGDSGTGIPVSDCFDVIKGWHNNKPNDPLTGVKRPTIVNMSWGYGTYANNVTTGGSYRGASITGWTGTGRDTSVGIVGSPRYSGSTFLGYRHVNRVSSVDADVQEMIDAGIHVCIAAGNSYQKIDVPSGTDYNNYYVNNFGNRYYHRGGSPFDDEAIVVGNVDSIVDGAHGGVEQKVSSSENGPGVDIYAPGQNIVSTCSTTSRFTGGNYPPNTSFKITTLGGTSMASPQVCGVGALILQTNPHMTPAELKAFVIGQSIGSMLHTTGLDVDYADSRSIKGGNNKYMKHPFPSEDVFKVTHS